MECVGPTPASNGVSCNTTAYAAPNECSKRIFEGKILHKRVITAIMNLTWAFEAHGRTLVNCILPLAGQLQVTSIVIRAPHFSEVTWIRCVLLTTVVRCKMQPRHLPVELQLLILTEVLAVAEQGCSNLVQRERTPLFILPLLLACKTFHNYLRTHSLYHRIRLWMQFRQITKQDLPVTIAILQGPGDGLLRANFTILDMHVRLERVGPSSADHDQQAFLVFEEQNMQSRGRLKHTKVHDWLVSETVPRPGKSRLLSATSPANGNSGDLVTKIPIFQYHHFLENTLEFSERNDLCVWIWKRSARFFSGHNIGVLVGGHGRRRSNRSIYLLDDREDEPIDCTNEYGHCKVCNTYQSTPTSLQFQFVVDSPRNGFLAYERPVDPPRNFTQDMLSNNVHFFAGLG